MKTRSALVHFPGYPFDINALMPSRHLAVAAGSLLDAGHTTRIFDYGTVTAVEELLEGKLSDLARSVSESILADPGLNPLQTLHTLWHIRASDRLLARKLGAQCETVAQRLAHQPGLHFAGLMIRAVEDLRYAAQIARRLKDSRPKLRVIAFGPLIDLYGDYIAREYLEFDCLCLTDVEQSLVGFAEKIDAPEMWASVPNIAVANGYYPKGDSQRDSLGLGNYPPPVYEPDTYPALRSGQKLRLFELEDNRGSVPTFADPRTHRESAVRMKPVSAVCNEIWRIATLYGARAFSLCGPAATASHMTAVGHELLRRGTDIVYARSSACLGVVPAMFSVLRASGCEVMSFSVDTGSQRLLDDFFGRGVTVTELETMLRASRSAGLYTIARFVYPCPADDYHTKAETIRLVERTRPDAAAVDVPQVHPQSEWFERSAHYGFRVRRERALARAMASARRFPLMDNQWPTLPFSVAGLSSSQVIGENRSLVEELEQRGVLASAPYDLVRLARLAGYENRERQFVARAQHELLSGDTSGVATLVDQFNEAVCVSAKGVALKPYEPSRMAVGN
ncbi:MAG: hypothetical protein KJ060_08365 [Candidatus Hydrogenedentes bacterium]|nr:hypothetical protein [Candidatus Hydrogenedentota bacterium]